MGMSSLRPSFYNDQITVKLTSSSYSWISELDKVFAEHGLETIQYIRLPIKNKIGKPWTFTQLMGAAELVEVSVIPECLKNPSLSPSAEEWKDSLKNTMDERQNGDIKVETDIIVAVGRKAD